MDGDAVDIAIVGGGLAGLITAVALQKATPDATVMVFERFPTVAKAGALIGLSPNAQAAIEAIDPQLHAAIMDEVITTGRSLVFNDKGDMVADTTVEAIMDGGGGGQGRLEKKYGRKMARWGWYEVHAAMTAALQADTVVMDRRFVDYEETEDGVRLDMRSEDGTKHHVTAKLVVGADGGYSPLRQQCLKDGPPRSPGTVIWRARVPPHVVGHLLQQGIIERSYFGHRLLGNVWKVDAASGDGSWVACAHASILKKHGMEDKSDPSIRTGQQVLPIGKSAHERVLRIFGHFPEEYVELIKATDPASIAEHGVYSRAVTERWGAGRVTLVGDAAHPVRPVSGQGLGAATEDALELAHALRNGGLTPAALRAYEDLRLPRLDEIEKQEWEMGESAYKRGEQTPEEAQAALERRIAYEDFLFSYECRPLHESSSTAAGNGISDGAKWKATNGSTSANGVKGGATAGSNGNAVAHAVSKLEVA